MQAEGSVKAHLLLIDDDQPLLRVLAEYLHRRNYEVRVCGDGAEAGRILNSGALFDIVLSDIRLPGASGLEVLAAAKALPQPPAVVLMTGFASVENVLDAMRQGAYAYVRKPIMDFDNELGRILEQALREARLKRENAELMAKLRKINDLLAARQEHVKRELEMAGHIQRSLLPADFARLGGVTVAAKRIIGEAVSGDFFDIIQHSDGRIGILAGQALGRDLPAAILMATITGHLRELARRFASPEKVMVEANSALRVVLEKGYENFVTAFYGIISPDRRVLTYACAGHPSPLHIAFSKPPRQLTKASGQFLGKYDDGEFESLSTPIHPQDRLVIFSENIPALVNDGALPLGVERMQRWAHELGIGNTGDCAEKFALLLENWDAQRLVRKNILLLMADMI